MRECVGCRQRDVPRVEGELSGLREDDQPDWSECDGDDTGCPRHARETDPTHTEASIPEPPASTDGGLVPARKEAPGPAASKPGTGSFNTAATLIITLVRAVGNGPTGPFCGPLDPPPKRLAAQGAKSVMPTTPRS